jgi:hypothetical protein
MGWHYFSIVEEVKNIIQTMINNQAPTVDPMDCCYTIKVIEKAYESARNGNKLVQI